MPNQNRPGGCNATPEDVEMNSGHTPPRGRRAGLALLYAAPIGLGGAEFRLPVLVGPLRYSARQAVPLNLAISLVTLAVALATRGRTLSFAALIPLLPAIGALIAGAVITAFLGPALASGLSEARLERVILILLVCIGIALIIEGLLPQQLPGLLPSRLPWHLGAGVLCGLAIGLVSSLLGVAGGELIIPTLVFAFGADIKTAGTGSLLVSLPTVVVGVLRYASRGAFAERGLPHRRRRGRDARRRHPGSGAQNRPGHHFERVSCTDVSWRARHSPGPHEPSGEKGLNSPSHQLMAACDGNS
jgi:uncharacterized membrane protein YfcA